MTGKPVWTETVKTAVAGLGIKGTMSAEIEDLQVLNSKALAVAEGLEQLIDSGKLDDADTQKLRNVLGRLRGAMQGGTISRETLAMALSEAGAALGVAQGSSKAALLQQRTQQLWQQIDQSNKDIDDDLEKMRKAGIVFDKKLWERHQQLSEELQAHPQDIRKQKELDAVDDQLLQQAEPQMDKCPDARPHFRDAKKKSEDRHQMVDHDLVALKKKEEAVLIVNLDWNTASAEQGKDASINDISLPNVGSKAKPAGKNPSVQI